MITENNYQEVDLGNISFNPRGNYSDTDSYEYLDLVFFEGGSYLCKFSNLTGVSPIPGISNDYWQCISIPGDITPEYQEMYQNTMDASESAIETKNEIVLIKQEVTNAASSVAEKSEHVDEVASQCTDYQKIHDDSLETTSKDIVGAINELNKNIANEDLVIVEDGKLYIKQADGTKKGIGVTLPTSGETVDLSDIPIRTISIENITIGGYTGLDYSFIESWNYGVGLFIIKNKIFDCNLNNQGQSLLNTHELQGDDKLWFVKRVINNSTTHSMAFLDLSTLSYYNPYFDVDNGVITQYSEYFDLWNNSNEVQTKTDRNLQTTSKNIVDAINEINKKNTLPTIDENGVLTL